MDMPEMINLFVFESHSCGQIQSYLQITMTYNRCVIPISLTPYQSKAYKRHCDSKQLPIAVQIPFLRNI